MMQEHDYKALVDILGNVGSIVLYSDQLNYIIARAPRG